VTSGLRKKGAKSGRDGNGNGDGDVDGRSLSCSCPRSTPLRPTKKKWPREMIYGWQSSLRLQANSVPRFVGHPLGPPPDVGANTNSSKICRMRRLLNIRCFVCARWCMDVMYTPWSVINQF